jgi:hypothetical protein
VDPDLVGACTAEARYRRGQARSPTERADGVEPETFPVDASGIDALATVDIDA